MSVQIGSVVEKSAARQTNFVVNTAEVEIDSISGDGVRELDAKYQSSPRAGGLWTSNGDANGVLLAFVDPPDKPVKEPKEPKESSSSNKTDKPAWGCERIKGEVEVGVPGVGRVKIEGTMAPKK